MSPRRLDVDVVQRRLRHLQQALDDLSSVGEVTVEVLRDEPITRAAVERLLQVVVDLAVEVNAHLVVAAGGAAPATGRQSFLDLAALGVLDQQLADRLAPSAGLRNVLVHQYVDIRPDLVVEAVAAARRDLPAYVRAVAAHVTDR